MSEEEVNMLPSIDPDVKKKWIKALREGPFVQLRKQLTENWNDEKDCPLNACCLGVLTALAVEEGVGDGTLKWSDDDDGRLIVLDEDGDWETWTDGDLPHAVAKWAFDNDQISNPVLVEYATQNGEQIEGHAINLNDKLEWTFDEIATAVEALPERKS